MEQLQIAKVNGLKKDFRAGLLEAQRIVINMPVENERHNEPSDNPTNGDMIMTMFPNAIYQEGFLYKIVNGKQYVFMSVTEHWWNAPYERRSKNE